MAIPTDSGIGSRAARPPGSAGWPQRGLRQFSRSVAGVVLARSRKGELHPVVDVVRLRLRPGGLLVLGLATETARAARLARVPRSVPASSRRAARRILARPAAGVVRGRDPSRQRRVSRDRHPARGPRRGRTRSPRFVVGPHGVPNRRNPLRFEPIYVEFREARTFAVSDLSARLHTKLTPHNRPTRQRCGRGQAPARSSAAPPCRSAASPP